MIELLEAITKPIINGPWANVASILGLLVSIIGFVKTYKEAQNSKSAAEQAREAVFKVRKDIRSVDTISNLSSAVKIMQEIRRHQRAGSWHILQERYAALKELLISIKAENVGFPDEYKTSIQSAIQQITRIDIEVDKALAKNESPTNIPKLNEIVSKQVDNLGEILAEIRANIGSNYD